MSAIWSGIAGVNGAAQKATIAPSAVQNHGETVNASTPQIMAGDQNIASAINVHKSISLLKIVFFNLFSFSLNHFSIVIILLCPILLCDVHL